MYNPLAEHSNDAASQKEIHGRAYNVSARPGFVPAKMKKNVVSGKVRG